MSSSYLMFNVLRREPDLITPAVPTPHEFKHLSDIDNQEGLRFEIPMIQFYQNNVSMEGKDPVGIIRKAIAKALVFYYPFAGRLREGPEGKLLVECTGEGIMFIEADAQVTRLMCGGFVFALRHNHTMSDGLGILQFVNALGETARGAQLPSVHPVWQRDLIKARDPQFIPHDNQSDNVILAHSKENQHQDQSEIVCQSFFFGPLEVAALRKHLPLGLCTSSSFEIITACIWKCRTVAINPNPTEEFRMICTINGRGKFRPPLPKGFYGNAFGFAMAVSTAAKLCHNPLEYALELVKSTKNELNNSQEMIRSWTDLTMLKMGKTHNDFARTSYVVSDVTRAGFEFVDFGWGKPVYDGPAKAEVGPLAGIRSFNIRVKNSNNGVEDVLVTVYLPRAAAAEFVAQVESLVVSDEQPTRELLLQSKTSKKVIKSAL